MSTTEITLDPGQLEQLADLIAARLSGSADVVATATNGGDQPATDLVTAEELARILRVDLKSIYRHAQRLGAIRIGRRLRFDPAKALDAWQTEPPPARAKIEASGRKQRARAAPKGESTTGDLLPVGRRPR